MKLDFLKLTWLYFVLSGCVLAASLGGLVVFGLKPSIDFTGGSLLEFSLETSTPPTAEALKSELTQIADISTVQPSGDNFIVRGQELTASTSAQIQDYLNDSYGATEEVRFESVGPILGAELLRKTLVAVILGCVAIMLYVAFQFKEVKYGICAVLAMYHDTLIVLGVFAWLGYFLGVEVDTLFVTALLTTLSFSIHDTIVVYDRIRESLHTSPQAEYRDIVNKAIAETLGRSINNSMTIIFMLVALFLLGGESIRWFVFALLIGTITGTYSSTFTAAPLLVLWEKIRKR